MGLFILKQKSTITLIGIIIIFIICLFFKYSFSCQFFVYGFTILLIGICSVVDIRKRMLPNPMIAVGFIFGILYMLMDQTQGVMDRILGLGLGGVVAIFSYILRGAIGMGDAKIIGIIGFALGLRMVFHGLLIAFGFAGICGLVLLVLRKNDLNDKMPFIPFVFLGLGIVFIC